MRKPPKRPFKRPAPDDEPRHPIVAIVPGSPTGFGIAMSRGKGDRVRDREVMAPDEARVLAEEMEVEGEDPEAVAGLRELAGRLPELMADAQAKVGGRCRIVPPRWTGPVALGHWIIYHRRLFQAAFRKAIRRGIAPDDVLIWGTPETDSMDDPPSGLVIVDKRHWDVPEDAPTAVAELFEKTRANRPRPGYFDILGSRQLGRFQGTFHGMMPIPADDESLPPALPSPGDELDN
jgi:hypothetical protein